MTGCHGDKDSILNRLNLFQEILADQRLWEVDELSFKLYKKDIRRFKPLGYDEEQQLMEKAAKGDTFAIERLVLSNLGFVIHVARKYQNLGLPLNDLISEGNIGLIKAAQKIQNNRFRFRSFAIYEIRGSILQAIYKHRYLIHYPTNVLTKFRRIQKFITKFELINGYCPTEGEIADGLNMAIEIVEDMRDIVLQEMSLDLLFDYIADAELFETIVDGLEMFDSEFNAESLYIDIDETLDKLYDYERKILKMFFGIGCDEITLFEIGDKFGLTKERTRQIKEKAIRKLKGLRSKNLRKYLG